MTVLQRRLERGLFLAATSTSIILLCIMLSTESPQDSVTTHSGDASKAADASNDRIPLFTVVEGRLNETGFGDRVTWMGDIHGDGVDDILIGTYTTEEGGRRIKNPAKAYELKGRQDRQFDAKDLPFIERIFYSICIGDVNGDGYSDVASLPDWRKEGSHEWKDDANGQLLEIRHGSPEGFAQDDFYRIECRPKDSEFPELTRFYYWRVGDVNGDGYDDVLVHCQKTFREDEGPSYPAEIQLFYGSTNGLPRDPSWRAVIPEDLTEKWDSLGPIHHADVNGDGYSDILFLFYGYASEVPPSPPLIEVSVHYGSKTGITLQPQMTLSFRGQEDLCGWVHSPIDLNRDDYDDIAIEWISRDVRNLPYESPTPVKQRVSIYLGSDSGLNNDPTQLIESTTTSIVSVSFADFNGDGLDDMIRHPWGFELVATSEPSEPPDKDFYVNFTFHLNEEGQIQRHPKWSYRLSSLPGEIFSWIVGDFDGDGAEDLAFGSVNHYLSTDISPGELIIVWGAGIQTISRPLQIDGAPCLFAKYKAYQFIVNTNPIGLGNNIQRIRLTLDAGRTDIVVEYDSSEIGGPRFESSNGDNIELVSTTDDIRGDEKNRTTWVIFKLFFDWGWPHEDPCDVLIELFYGNGTSLTNYQEDCFYVENDLEIVDDIHAVGEWQGPILEGSWTRANENITLSGMKVVYEGTSNIYPPSDSCDLQVVDDDGDSVSISVQSGSSMSMIYRTDPMTDPDETLKLTLEGLPGNSNSPSERTFELKVDGDHPTFQNPVPDSNDWHSELGTRAAITSMDLNGSGIDASTLEYSYSTNGIEGYGAWNRIDLDNEPDGETVDAMVYITLEEGDDNYLRWRVKDMVGNGYTISEDLQIKIDTQHIVFSIPTPEPERWYTSITLDSGCTISDRTGSGVDVSSIQFRVSHSYPSQYGDWIDWNEGPLIDNQEVVTKAEVEFSESRYNFIQWRAKDVAGNGYSTSPHYRYRIDISPPVFTEISPKADEKHESSEVTIRAVTADDLSGVHWYFQYRYGTSGEESMGDWEEIDGHGSVPVFTFNVRFDRGIQNVLQLRILDNAGNNATSEILSIWVNRRPVAIIATPTNGSVFYENETIELDGTGSYDDDGDSIVYGWWVAQNETPILVGIGGTITLPPGTHDVSLTIWDGYDGGYGDASVQITVLEVPPEPETHVDEDNWMLVMIIIIIIIIIVTLAIVLRRTQLTPL